MCQCYRKFSLFLADQALHNRALLHRFHPNQRLVLNSWDFSVHTLSSRDPSDSDYLLIADYCVQELVDVVSVFNGSVSLSGCICNVLGSVHDAAIVHVIER